MSRKLIITAAAAVVLFGSTPALALEGVTDRVESVSERVEQDTKNTVKEVRSTAQANVQTAEARLQSQKEQIETRKAELRERLEAKKTERKERLEGRRLAQCQNRQANINELMDKSANVGRDKLTRIQNFEQGIKDFYVAEGLSSDTYESVVADVDVKEADAIAALDTMQAWEYDCEAIDGARPSEEIRLNRQAKREGLKEYRDSVQVLLKTVREAFTAQQQEGEDAQQ